MAKHKRMRRAAPAKQPAPPFEAGPGDSNTPAAYRKVTYSLPEAVASELDRRSARNERRKSRVVAEALAFYFAAQDRQALALLYGEAAQDPQFRADNEAVDRDFAALDRELDDPQR